MDETQFIVEAARKHALNEETVRKQVDRLGTTEYELSDLVLECDENVMVPMSRDQRGSPFSCAKL